MDAPFGARTQTCRVARSSLQPRVTQVPKAVLRVVSRAADPAPMGCRQMPMVAASSPASSPGRRLRLHKNGSHLRGMVLGPQPSPADGLLSSAAKRHEITAVFFTTPLLACTKASPYPRLSRGRQMDWHQKAIGYKQTGCIYTARILGLPRQSPHVPRCSHSEAPAFRRWRPG